MLHTRIIPARPAMILEGKKKSLVISDLHIGFESVLAAKGIFVGKNTAINETIEELSSIIDAEKPDSVILLGDIKDGIKNITKNEWSDVPKFFSEIMKKCEIILIPGNHDANIQQLIPENTTTISSSGMVEENILLTHGHTMPSENFSHVEKIVMGHIHPVFFDQESLLNGQRVWVYMKVEKQDIFPNRDGELEITIVPAFNKYITPTYKTSDARAISPIIDKIKKINTARIVTLDGDIIGNENNLDKVIKR